MSSVREINIFRVFPEGGHLSPVPHWHAVIRKEEMIMGLAAPSSQHSMGHFSVVFVKTKIFYGPFNFCMVHLHWITKLYVSNGPWPLPFPITGHVKQKMLKMDLNLNVYWETCKKTNFKENIIYINEAH